MPQFAHLQNEVIIAPVSVGENTVETHIRPLAWSLHTQVCWPEFIWDVVLGPRYCVSKEPGGTTGGWRTALEME